MKNSEEFVGCQLFPQGFAPDEPSGDRFEAFPTAITFQIHAAAEGRAYVMDR